MSITRRGLLAGILGAGIAPAIAHNPMRLWVPRRELIREVSGDEYTRAMNYGGPPIPSERMVRGHLVIDGVNLADFKNWPANGRDGGFLVPRWLASEIITIA